LYPDIKDQNELKLKAPSKQWVLNLINSDDKLTGRFAEELENNRINNCTITYLTYWYYKIIELIEIMKYNEA
jgi:hypothetical protein